MKVQPGKANVQSQMTTKTEAAAAAAQSVTTDFFSALIASMANQSAAPEVKEETVKTEINQAQNQDDDEEKPALNAIFSEINALLAQQNDSSEVKTSQLPVAATNKPVNNVLTPAATPNMPSAVLTMKVSADKLSAMALNSDMVLNIDQPVKVPAVPGKTELAESAEDKQLQPDSVMLALKAADESQAVIPDIMINQEQKPKKTVFEQASERAIAPAPADYDIPPRRQTLNSVQPALGVMPEQSEQPVTVFSLQKGQIYHPDQQKNNYVNAFVQMGNLINGVTMSSSMDSSPTNNLAREASSVDYGEILSKTMQPVYQLKVELLPPAMGSLVAETYNANIKIYPPELGSVIAKLKLDKKNAELVIVTENNRVKEVIESNLSQLRQQFQQADINLTSIKIEVQTSQSGSKEQNSQNQQADQSFSAKEDTKQSNQTNSSSNSPRQRIDSIIDTYA